MVPPSLTARVIQFLYAHRFLTDFLDRLLAAVVSLLTHSPIFCRLEAAGGFGSSGMWCCVVWWVFTDVSAAVSGTSDPPTQRYIPKDLTLPRCIKARLHGSPRLISAVESTKVSRVNSSFQRKWSTGLTGEQVGDGQLSFNVVDSLWVTHHRLPVCVLFLYVWFYFW